MTVDGIKYPGEVKEKKAAKKIYEAAKVIHNKIEITFTNHHCYLFFIFIVSHFYIGQSTVCRSPGVTGLIFNDISNLAKFGTGRGGHVRTEIPTSFAENQGKVTYIVY